MVPSEMYAIVCMRKHDVLFFLLGMSIHADVRLLYSNVLGRQ